MCRVIWYYVHYTYWALSIKKISEHKNSVKQNHWIYFHNLSTGIASMQYQHRQRGQIGRWDGENIAMDSVLKQVQKREKGDNETEAEKG